MLKGRGQRRHQGAVAAAYKPVARSSAKGTNMTNPNQSNPFDANAGQQTPAYQGANVPPAAPATQYAAPQQPQYAAPQAPAAPAYQQSIATSEKTNGFAVASLIFGLLGGLLGLIFGIIALNQIKKNGGKGKGLAIAGIVLFILWIPISIVLNMGGDTTAALALAAAL